jgi:SOS response regulatory protein OraA/RecX
MLDRRATMAKLKTYLMEQQMSEAEIEEYLDYLYAEYLMKQEAYRYEDNPNIVREGGDG